MGAFCSASVLALCLGIIPVSAQDTKVEKTPTLATDAPVVLDAMVVSGVRASLISAQEIKENSFLPLEVEFCVGGVASQLKSM